jgi:hypothetical protein
MKVDYPNPFKSPGQWFKGNLHTHTTASDGIRTPQETVDHYSRNGYDFLSITDHGVLTDPTTLNPQGMTLIPGEEICLGSSQAGTNTHIVVANIRESLPLTDFNQTTDPQEAIDLTAQQGGLPIHIGLVYTSATSSSSRDTSAWRYTTQAATYTGEQDSPRHT